MDGLRDRIKPLGWRQGSILPPELSTPILTEQGFVEENEPVALVILTQDCDLLADSLDQEPFVELILGSGPAQHRRGRDRSNRQVNIGIQGIQAADQLTYLTFRDRNRFRAPRECLLDGQPHPDWKLQVDELRHLLNMVVRRFQRPALSDTFNNRLDPAFASKKEGYKLLKKNHELFEELRFSVPRIMEELDDHEKYEVRALIAILTDYADETAAQEILEEIENLIRTRCDGMDMGAEDADSHVKLYRRDNLTLAGYDDLVTRSEPWDWEWLSRPEGEIEREETEEDDD